MRSISPPDPGGGGGKRTGGEVVLMGGDIGGVDVRALGVFEDEKTSSTCIGEGLDELGR